ncbi:suppressor of forked protein-domain-containing protein [Xylariomycetidae sp. FL0641]|nr:suppressor of forked protein-domain-containing protein [Xylariomycetidae sp. FL0641]
MASEGLGDAVVQQGANSAWGDDGWTGTAENNGANTEHSEQQVQDPSVHDLSAVQADPVHNTSAGDTADSDDDGAEYDPESVTITTTAPLPPVERSDSAASSSRPTKKPKTAGGFIVGSSDDEDDSPAPEQTPPAGALKPTPTPTPVQNIPQSRSPLQQSATPQNGPGVGFAQAGADSVPGAVNSSAAAGADSKSRLPTDIVGILEDRITEDPRGDLDAWLALIDEHKQRHKIDDARSAYERFLQVFPQSADIWVAYLDMELGLNNFQYAEKIFASSLLSVPNVRLWTAYLNYIRRRNDLNDPSGQARQTINQSYEFVLDNIGQDRDAGTIWQDYIQFLKSGPGQAGGGSWQDQQKMDILRKAYQRATCIPTPVLNVLWREYDQFELGLNKMAGRKFLQERSPSYMTARTANIHLENITRGLNRTNLPRLPPAPGFEGDQEYLQQVRLWKSWIAWEKEDPLVIKSEDPATYQHRVSYVYKQALMALRFWPEMWVEAAEWCFENNVTSKDGADLGLKFLVDGLEANPESSLLALKRADHIESTQRSGEDPEAKSALAQAVRAPYNKVLDTLYEMLKKLKRQEIAAVAKVEQEAATEDSNEGSVKVEDDDDEGEVKARSSQITNEARIKAIRDSFGVQTHMLSQQISYLWIALARAFRRLQGQGKGGPAPTGVRAIFTEARNKGRLTADVYIEIANIEWDVYQDPVATKIYDRGAKLFPESEHFFVEYLKHLHGRRDFTNARVVFSTTVKRFREKAELIPKLKPLYAYFHDYEARFGELAQVKELEKQMNELFPEESSVAHFAARFSSQKFNPINARVIISPAQQMQPKRSIMQSVEQPSSIRSSPQPMPQPERSPRPQIPMPVRVNSPKRPFPADDEEDLNPPRKLPRGASPLKGAAGRRLDQQRRAQQGQGTSTYTKTPAPIPRDITFLLSLICPAEQYNAARYIPEAMVKLIRETPIVDYPEWKAKIEPQLARAHTRQASTEYPAFGRDSPAQGARPESPYNPYSNAGRGPTQPPGPYRNSPLRPGSSGTPYDQNPAAGYQPPGPSPFNPMAYPQSNTPAYGGWPGNFGGYAPPPGQGPPPYGGGGY